MTKLQAIVIACCALLFCVLYFGLDTKPSEQKLLEKSRSVNFETTSIPLIAKEAKASLSKENASYIEALEIQLNNETEMEPKNAMRETLSSHWFKLGHPAISGYYAEEIANTKEDDDSSWGIAGTSYLYGVQFYQDEKLKEFCFKRSVKALEKAISLDDENVDHKINLALAYVENPPKENPMTGVLQLVGLNKKHPEEVKVINQLGRLAIKTNQIDRAIERLTSAEALSKDNKTTICLLAEAYDKKGDETLSKQYAVRCNELINK